MKKKALVLAVYVACATPTHAADKIVLASLDSTQLNNQSGNLAASLSRHLVTHKIKSGDTLSAIAKRYKHRGISLNRMMKSIYHVNPHAFIRGNLNKIKKGAVLEIPSVQKINHLDVISAAANADYQANKYAPKTRKSVKGGNTYRVKRGDTLSKITRRYNYRGVSFTKMMAAIHRTNPKAFSDNRINKLKAGAYIRIPTYTEVIKKYSSVSTGNSKTVKQNLKSVELDANQITPPVKQNTSAAVVTTAEKLQNSITKVSQTKYSAFSSVPKRNASPEKVKSYSSAELSDLYKQAFGKKTAKRSSTASKGVSEGKSKTYSSDDLANLYKQAFGKKATRHKSTSNTNSSEESQGSGNLAALYAKAFGKKPSMIAPAHVTVDLRVNKTKVGEVTVFSNASGEMDRVDTKELLAILKKILKDHIYKRVQTSFSSSKKVLINRLKKQGIKASYNPINLSLDLFIKPEQRKPRILSLMKKRAVSVRAENKVTAEDISGYINMYSNINIDPGNNMKTDLKMKFEGSLNINNAVLETTLDLNGNNWRAGQTTLTYDKPDKLQRFILGDISTGNRNFQENIKLIGLSTSKSFFMDPDLQIRPKANESFILETESEVAVYTNNQLRQRFYLEKGVYSLEDIGLSNGENNIRIKITDSFGKVTTKSSQQYYDSHLLKPDLSFYSFSVGYLNKKGKDLTQSLERMPILSGYYEKGISENLTMSFDAQLSSDNYLFGSEAITSISLGSLKYSVAVSGGKSKKLGFASRFEFKPNIYRDSIGKDTLREDSLSLDQKVKCFVNSWTINGEYRNKDFSMISEEFDLDNEEIKRLRARVQTQFSVDFGNKWRGSLNLGATDYYNDDKKLSANVAAIKRFDNGGRVRVGVDYDTQDEFSLNLQFSMPLFKERSKARKSMEMLVNSKENAFSSKLSVAPRSQVGKNSMAGSVAYEHDDRSDRQRVTFNYRDTHYDTKLSAINIKNRGSNKGNNQQISIGLNSSLACIGTDCATSYPISDSFALVTGPSNQNRPIAINNGQGQFKYTDNNDLGLPDNYTSVISKKGKHAVVPLESYRFQNINIDESTLPNGYDSEKTEFEVFPRYHQGFLVKAGGSPATIVGGILVDKNKKILAYKGGQWIPLNKDGKTIAFFSNKAGQFRMNSVPKGKYKLELYDYPEMNPISISVPDKKGQLYDLGNLVIQ